MRSVKINGTSLDMDVCVADKIRNASVMSGTLTCTGGHILDAYVGVGGRIHARGELTFFDAVKVSRAGDFLMYDCSRAETVTVAGSAYITRGSTIDTLIVLSGGIVELDSSAKASMVTVYAGGILRMSAAGAVEALAVKPDGLVILDGEGSYEHLVCNKGSIASCLDTK